MPVIRVSETLSVATQPELSAFAGFAADGFKVVINNRPEGEEAAQPSSAAEATAAAAAGLGYAHLPVTVPTISEPAVRQFHDLLAKADGPVLAHCKSGTRSLMLYVIGEVLDGRMTTAEVRPFGARLGIDLAGAEAWLVRNGH